MASNQAGQCGRDSGWGEVGEGEWLHPGREGTADRLGGPPQPVLLRADV